MILRVSSHDETTAPVTTPKLSRREARFLDDLMTAGAALAIGAACWAVVSLVGV